MHEKICKLCSKIFTRRWNLERHLQDVHKIYDNTKEDYLKSEIIDYNDLPNNIDRNRNFRNKSNDNNINEVINNENSYYYNNFSNTFPSPADYIGKFDPYSNFNPSPLEKEKRLSLDDKIRIQKVLTILENHLKKIGYPPGHIFRLKTWLNYRCSSAKTDEPLKKFLVHRKLGYLWPG
jgi:hypothetical protein